MGQVDQGKGLAALNVTNDQAGMQDVYNQVDSLRQLIQAHRDYTFAWQLPHSLMRGDTPNVISFPGTMARSARQCMSASGGAPHWQTQVGVAGGAHPELLRRRRVARVRPHPQPRAQLHGQRRQGQLADVHGARR